MGLRRIKQTPVPAVRGKRMGLGEKVEKRKTTHLLTVTRRGNPRLYKMLLKMFEPTPMERIAFPDHFGSGMVYEQE